MENYCESISSKQSMFSASEFDQFGSLVAAIGSRDFGGTFYRFFRDLIDAEQCSALAFSGDEKPEPIVMEGEPGNSYKIARKLTRDYLRGGYHQDRNWRTGRGEGNRVHIITPDDVENQDFRDHYYDQPGIECELLLVGTFRKVLYYVSFYHSKSRINFDENDARLIQMMSGLIIKTLHSRREWLLERAEPKSIEKVSDHVMGEVKKSTSREESLLRLRDVLLRERSGISPREAEVCASIALGYSSHAISSKCNISINTVLTHRKRAYAKLGISSQNELFSLYLGALRQF